MAQDGAAAQAINQQNALNTGNRVRDQLRLHEKSVGSCDGTSKQEVRNWIQGVDRAETWIEGATDQAVVQMAASLITGPLATHLTRLKEAAIQAQQQLTWAAIKTEIRRAFLEVDEEETLREVADNMVQRQHKET